MARRLIEAGVRLVSVTAWTGLPPGEKFRNVQTWDMHGDGAGPGQHLRHRRTSASAGRCRTSTRPCRRCSTTWKTAACSRATLVVMVGEFGRTPQVERRRPRPLAGVLLGAARRRRHPRRPGVRRVRQDRRLREGRPGAARRTSARRCSTPWACRRRRASAPTASPGPPAPGSRCWTCSANASGVGVPVEAPVAVHYHHIRGTERGFRPLPAPPP